jgi:alpha-tubulin suppressor-like RCC1 family protein
LALDKTGKKVFIWGSFKPLYSHENRSDLAANPTECHEISSVLKKTHSSIKKLKAAEGALAFLTDNGKLFVWGDSKFGQLAVNQMREDIFDTIVRKPEEVYHSYEGNIVDFDLSDNMMVFMTGKIAR